MEKFQSIDFSFKVDTTRSDKTFPITSPEMNKILGGEILSKFPNAKVNLRSPQIVPEILILSKSIFISVHRIMGIGGLPVGMSGHLITLLSGGIDSPVASFMMSKRGCSQSFVFFHSYPFVGEEVLEKIFSLSKILGKFQTNSKLFIIPFGEIQNLISKNCREEYRTVVFRKFMVEAANLLADQIGGEALLTGDSISQVSSQTIGNLAILDGSSRRPIFRPLIGLNKIEIIEKAQDIGTYETSILPQDDACSLFAPLRPIISPNIKYWEKFSQDFQINEDLLNCIKNAKVYEISPTGTISLLGIN
jgi:thiamine biosynthesis protein ThiI